VPDYKNEALSSNSSIAKKEKSPQDNYMCIYIYLCVIYIHIHLILFVYMKGNLESKKNFKSSSKWKRKKNGGEKINGVTQENGERFHTKRITKYVTVQSKPRSGHTMKRLETTRDKEKML
jgi:hypothetical protein